jgi:hypothetical protein
MRWIYAALLSASFAASSTTHAAPLTSMCDLLPKAKATELIGAPVTMQIPAKPEAVTIAMGYAGPATCMYIGPPGAAAVSMIPVPPGITSATFFPHGEHTADLGTDAAFTTGPNGEFNLNILLPGSRAMIIFMAQKSKNPNLKSDLIEIAKLMLPQIPAYVDHTPPSKIYRGWIESGDPHTAVGTPPEKVRDMFMRGGQYEFVDDATGQSAQVDDFTSGRGYDGLHIEVNGYFHPGEPKFHITNIISVIKSAPASKPAPSQK